MEKSKKITLYAVALLLLLFLVPWKKCKRQPPAVRTEVRTLTIQDTARIQALEDTVDYLLIQIGALKNRYSKLQDENTKMRRDISRKSDDELRSILTKRYTDSKAGR